MNKVRIGKGITFYQSKIHIGGCYCNEVQIISIGFRWNTNKF